MTNDFLLFISQQPCQQIIQYCRVDWQVAVSVAAEERIGWRLFHQLCNPGFRRFEVEHESEQALSCDAAVTGVEQFIKGFFA
jgi:hypothetical protein